MLLKRKFVTVIMILLIFSAKCHISDVYNICQKTERNTPNQNFMCYNFFIYCENDNELNDLEKRISDIENEFNTENELKQEINLAKNKEEFKKNISSTKWNFSWSGFPFILACFSASFFYYR